MGGHRDTEVMVAGGATGDEMALPSSRCLPAASPETTVVECSYIPHSDGPATTKPEWSGRLEVSPIDESN